MCVNHNPNFCTCLCLSRSLPRDEKLRNLALCLVVLPQGSVRRSVGRHRPTSSSGHTVTELRHACQPAACWRGRESPGASRLRNGHKTIRNRELPHKMAHMAYSDSSTCSNNTCTGCQEHRQNKLWKNQLPRLQKLHRFSSIRFKQQLPGIYKWILFSQKKCYK